MQEIFSTEVIVLESDGTVLGQMCFQAAQKLAQEKGLDLVQVSKKGHTSICKIIDRGKWLYEQKKKSKNQRHAHTLKEVKFGLRIDKHDQQTKSGHINRFLEKGLDVRVIIEMRGRERAHPELAEKKLDGIVDELNCEIKPNSRQRNSRQVSVVIKAKKAEGKHVPERKEDHAEKAQQKGAVPPTSQ